MGPVGNLERYSFLQTTQDFFGGSKQLKKWALEICWTKLYFTVAVVCGSFPCVFVLYCAFSCDSDGLGWEGANSFLPAQKKCDGRQQPFARELQP